MNTIEDFFLQENIEVQKLVKSNIIQSTVLDELAFSRVITGVRLLHKNVIAPIIEPSIDDCVFIVDDGGTPSPIIGAITALKYPKRKVYSLMREELLRNNMVLPENLTMLSKKQFLNIKGYIKVNDNVVAVSKDGIAPSTILNNIKIPYYCDAVLTWINSPDASSNQWARINYDLYSPNVYTNGNTILTVYKDIKL